MVDRKIKQSINNDNSIDLPKISTDDSFQIVPDVSSDEKETLTNAPKVNIWESLEKLKKEIIETYRQEVESVKQNLRQQFEKTIKSAKKELETKIDDSKLTIIETLGIFVALFTFISIDVQMFKIKISFLSALGFVFITLGALLFFIFILHLFLGDYKKSYIVQHKNLFLAMFIFVFMLLIGGAVAISWDYYGYTYKFYDEFYTKGQIDNNITSQSIKTKNQLDDLKKCLKEGGWNKCF